MKINIATTAMRPTLSRRKCGMNISGQQQGSPGQSPSITFGPQQKSSVHAARTLGFGKTFRRMWGLRTRARRLQHLCSWHVVDVVATAASISSCQCDPQRRRTSALGLIARSLSKRPNFRSYPCSHS